MSIWSTFFDIETPYEVARAFDATPRHAGHYLSLAEGFDHGLRFAFSGADCYVDWMLNRQQVAELAASLSGWLERDQRLSKSDPFASTQTPPPE